MTSVQVHDSTAMPREVAADPPLHPSMPDDRGAKSDPGATNPDPPGIPARLARRLRAVAVALAVYPLAGGILSIAGWVFDRLRLTDWLGTGISIQPTSALAVTAAGAAALCLALRRRAGAAAFGVVTALIGGATLLEWIAGANLPIDDLLTFGRTWGREGVVAPGRTRPPGSLSWCLLGTALALATGGSRCRRGAGVLAAITTTISLLSLLGYLYGADILFTLPLATAIALQTSTFVMAVSLAVFLNLPESAPTRSLLDPGAAGTLVRHNAPLLLFLPVLIGLIGAHGVRLEFYEPAFWASLRTLIEMGLFLVILRWTATAVGRHTARAADQERATHAAERRLTDSRVAGERRFRSIFESVAVSLWEKDFSAVAAAIDRLRRSGVTDFRRYFREHPEFVQQAIGMVRVLDVNDATVRMFKAGDKARLLGSLPDIFGPESLPAFAGQLIAVAEDRPYFESEATLRTFAGDRLFVFFTMVLPRSDQPIRRVFFSVFDLTERRQLEMERTRLLHQEREARGEAERANAVKDQFLATLSHELRSPLNAILGWVRLLEKRPEDRHMTQEAITVIARNARAQADLIADLLDMNRIMSGKVKLDLHDTVLDDVIAQSIETFRPAAEAKEIAFTSVIDPAPATVRADTVRLQQIIGNMLSNAVKFTPRGGSIRVSLAQAGGQAEIAVSDTGIGIDPKFLPYVFDRFRQADSSTTREHGGLGLGLSIVRHLVELHGFTVTAHSAGRGLGATFTVRLPLEPPRARPGPRPPPGAERSAAEDDFDLEGVTILAVDDQPDARDLLKVVLERRRARVITAGSADEALGLLDGARPDVILCDIGMPGKDGYGFIREVRRRRNPAPALAVTAFAHDEDRLRALGAGYQGQLAKPIEPADLVRAIVAFVRPARKAGA